MLRSASLAMLGAVGVTLIACGGEPARREPPSVAISRERFTVREVQVADLKPVAATVTTKDMSEARARIGGTLVKLTVREGDQVARGQVIGLIADERLALETTGYAAQVAAAAAEAQRARAELVRVQTLYEKGFYAKARLEQSEAASRAADAKLKAAEAQRAASAELSAQGAVLAPSAGRVLRAEVPAGSVVTAGQSIATVTAGDPLLRLEIPEGQARALRVGSAVLVETADLPGVAASGVVSQIYPAVTAGRVVADIAAAGLSDDLVGQRVRVRVAVGERKALIVPRRFIATRFGVDFARTLDAGGRTSEVAVQIAPGPTPAEVEVLSGLAAGDVLLVQGAGR